MSEDKNLPTTAAPKQRLISSDVVPILDTAKFEMMQRIAQIMANSSLIPDALCKVKIDKDWVDLPFDRILANCFLIVNQSVRWGADPFSVAQCVSVVHGKLCYEGKLVAGVMDAKLGIQLSYTFGLWDDAAGAVDTTKEGKGDALGVIVAGIRNPAEGLITIEGCVRDWKTTGNNSPWSAPSAHKRMLRYRGAREWARAYEPALLIGVYTDDEMSVLQDDLRARRATPVGGTSTGLAEKLLHQATETNGFNANGIAKTVGKSDPKTPEKIETIDPETGEITEEGKDADVKVETTVVEATDTETVSEDKKDVKSKKTKDVDKEEDKKAETVDAEPEMNADLLRQYGKTLFRVDKVASLSNAAKAFWDANGGWPRPSKEENDAASAIFNLHKDRCSGKIETAQCESDIKELLG